METKNTNYEHCSLARILEHVGEWYNILILRDLMLGMTLFDDFHKSLGISTNTLSKRLQGLVDSGLLERRRYQERPPRDEYILTEAGHEFLPIVTMMMAYGNKYFSPNGIDTLIIDKESGQPISPVLIDQVTGKPVNATTVLFAAGPAASLEKCKHFEDLGLPVIKTI